MARKYTPEEKQRVLDLHALYGPCRASRDTGIPKGTVAMWAKKAGVASGGTRRMEEAGQAREARVKAKRAEMQELFADVGVACLTRAKEPKTVARDVQSLVVAAATALDKLRLEAGEVTSRDEHRHDFSHRSTDDLIAEAESILRDAKG